MGARLGEQLLEKAPEHRAVVRMDERHDRTADQRVFLPAEQLPDGGTGVGDDRVRGEHDRRVGSTLEQRSQCRAEIRRDTTMPTNWPRR